MGVDFVLKLCTVREEYAIKRAKKKETAHTEILRKVIREVYKLPAVKTSSWGWS